ncbi:MAG: DUF21 domain-containing protein [Planctomycetes bacterium]|nr:DUF21 domain-containing protein [Planctomycetota bacterium]
MLIEVEKNISVSASVVLSFVFLSLFFIFGEILPKTLGAILPYGFSRIAAPLIFRLLQTMQPLTQTLEALVRGFNRLLGIEENENRETSSQALVDLMDVTEKSGHLNELHADILEKIIHLRKLRLKDICIPRVDVKSCSMTHSLQKVLQQANDWGFSVIPLYREHHDDIEDYLDCGHTLAFSNLNVPVWRCSRKIAFFPENARMDYIVMEFLERELPLALVTDEYGDMAGLVTWNDVMRTMQHEMIQLPYDSQGSSFKIYKGREKVRNIPSIHLDEENDSVTLSGYLISKMDSFPAVGDEIAIDGFLYTMTSCSKKQIEEVMVRKIPPGVSE